MVIQNIKQLLVLVIKMNREKIAAEILKLAKDLTADSRPSMFKFSIDAYNKLVREYPLLKNNREFARIFKDFTQEAQQVDDFLERLLSGRYYIDERSISARVLENKGTWNDGVEVSFVVKNDAGKKYSEDVIITASEMGWTKDDNIIEVKASLVSGGSKDKFAQQAILVKAKGEEGSSGDSTIIVDGETGDVLLKT